MFIDWLARRNGASKQRTGQEHVDIITFYNEVFIPSVKPLLVELGPGGATMKSDQIPEVINTNAGTYLLSYFQLYAKSAFVDTRAFLFAGHLAQCPGSPKISPFPSLPDMSPKKVSATHNVYVSPLRSSKVPIYLFVFLWTMILCIFLLVSGKDVSLAHIVTIF